MSSKENFREKDVRERKKNQEKCGLRELVWKEKARGKKIVNEEVEFKREFFKRDHGYGESKERGDF